MKYEQLKKLFPKIKENISLAPYTTFKIGGLADLFIEIEEIDELISLINKTKELDLKYFILGGGSNLLFSDQGYRGLIIKINFTRMEQNDNELTAGSGTNLGWLVNEAKNLELSGIECLVGIPGTLGGAVVGNAGAKDEWISSSISSVTILNSDQKIQNLTKDECDFGYRTSRFKNTQEIVLSATLRLSKKTAEEIGNKMKNFLDKKINQPKEPSAGSIFKNPQGDFAGRLIEEAGLKGEKIGDAQISENHANFIVNLGGATASDVLKLIDLARQKVKEKFNIDLELEIKII